MPSPYYPFMSLTGRGRYFFFPLEPKKQRSKRKKKITPDLRLSEEGKPNTSAVRSLIFRRGGKKYELPQKRLRGRLCFHCGRFAAERNIFSRCLLTSRRLLAVFTFKYSSEELRAFKFKKRATLKNVSRRSALNLFSFNDSRYFMYAVEQ